MSAPDIARAIKNLEQSAGLIEDAVVALTMWDPGYDDWKEREAVRELYFKALTLRLLLEPERRERVLH